VKKRHSVNIAELVKGILKVDDSLRVRGTDLWLDPPKQKPLAFVSHAHSDHLIGGTTT